MYYYPSDQPVVALRKESVDRNGERLNNPVKVEVSLSARRAWIEICSCCYLRPKSSVALRKESVDRNTALLNSVKSMLPSLSARRAWIEILTTVLHWYHISVALRKESVDRNCQVVSAELRVFCRSPQGERG